MSAVGGDEGRPGMDPANFIHHRVFALLSAVAKSRVHVIARRRSRRGNPEVLFFARLMWRTSSQSMELDCRVGYASSQ
ncbi:hypothetical protein [Candidatus Accumulibacter sp. ACC007]|uniref:hypothetical protein n=1 Tax=Candidatus Accumulibacter sp. ACC007 TaxID=2823333 RepID=UPI0025B8F250|nr:hypothetical protein [Candidatus Accumulibacter sp. ACC007]